ncbi:hypothetical protein D3C81_1221110 [compost metagenome]
MDVSIPVAAEAAGAAELAGSADLVALSFPSFPPPQPARSASVSTDAAAADVRLPILLVIRNLPFICCYMLAWVVHISWERQPGSNRIVNQPLTAPIVNPFTKYR